MATLNPRLEGLPSDQTKTKTSRIQVFETVIYGFLQLSCYDGSVAHPCNFLSEIHSLIPLFQIDYESVSCRCLNPLLFKKVLDSL
jgi:hypothetical protein